MEKTIKGNNHEGIERSYTFNLMSYKQGVMLAHKYASFAALAFSHLKEFFQSQADSVEDNEAGKNKVESKPKGIADLIAIIPQIFNESRMEELAKILMAGATVSGERILKSHDETIEVDGKKLSETVIDKSEKFSYTMDKEGFCELFGEDIIEFYIALFYAVVANYPKYLLPFLDTGDEDSTQDS